LGCKAYELEVGTEFSVDEGRTWWVVRTEPKYLDEGCNHLCFLGTPLGTTSLSLWEEFLLYDSLHVLLEPEWKG
jgi:hypothetical protein